MNFSLVVWEIHKYMAYILAVFFVLKEVPVLYGNLSATQKCSGA
jgi:hypothetical protein